jgi:hypothetical protein
MTEPLLTYGLSESGLMHIDEVDNGLGCNCRCPNCKEFLIARNRIGMKKVHHFSHSSRNNCKGAYESALHLLAKEILYTEKTLRVPNFHHDYDRQNWSSFFKVGKIITFDEVLLEQTIFTTTGNKIIADAIGVIRGKKVVIEFAKTHFIDDKKNEKLKALQYPSLEIDLSHQLLDRKELMHFLLLDTSLIYWITNPRLNEVR